MEKVLNQILEKLTTIETKVDSLETKVDGLEKSQSEMNSKLDSICDQTAILTEFKTSTEDKLNKIVDDIDFIKHEGFETKQDLFTIKRNLKSIK